ncbi:hypothetical protein [Neorhizobium galegae]|uniref:hypothetical protein n=1 Tax=Neorhizobium galegae TaxID=399 RepID=UPI000B26519B|nr:hypothetical protein [Neorhizobium galegae]
MLTRIIEAIDTVDIAKYPLIHSMRSELLNDIPNRQQWSLEALVNGIIDAPIRAS